MQKIQPLVPTGKKTLIQCGRVTIRLFREPKARLLYDNILATLARALPNQIQSHQLALRAMWQLASLCDEMQKELFTPQRIAPCFMSEALKDLRRRRTCVSPDFRTQLTRLLAPFFARSDWIERNNLSTCIAALNKASKMWKRTGFTIGARIKIRLNSKGVCDDALAIVGAFLDTGNAFELGVGTAMTIDS